MAVALIALVEQFLQGERLQFPEVPVQGGLDGRDGLSGVVVRAAEGLGDDLLNDLEFREILGVQPQRPGGLGGRG